MINFFKRKTEKEQESDIYGNLKMFNGKPNPAFQEPEKPALEQLVKDNFCKAKGIVGCSYYKEIWCPKTCGFYENAERRAKYWI